jgi:hypothetical protein
MMTAMRVALPLAVLGLCGCSSGPTALRQMQAEQAALIGEAMTYRRCMQEHQYLPERCKAQRQLYEDELAAFKARHGDR